MNANTSGGTQNIAISKITIIFFISAIVLGAFFRFYKLNEIPPGFTFDEAAHALDALDILDGKFTLVSPRTQQAAMGYMYMLAGVIKIFGANPVTQRVLTAVFGFLLIPASFFAIRALFEKEANQKAGLIAAFSSLLIATSFWAIVASRIGYEYIIPPVFAMGSIFFLWQGYWRKRWGTLLLAAIFSALGFYGYIASAPFMLVIPFSLLLHTLLCRKLCSSKPKIWWKGLIFFSLFVFLIALPLLFEEVSGAEPEATLTYQSLIFTQAANPIEGGKLLLESAVAHTQRFLAIRGQEDADWMSKLSASQTLLDPVLAVCFVIGLLLCLKRINQLPYLLVVVYWGAMIAPSLLTGPTPRYFRMVSAIPPTYIFIAIAWAELYYWLKERLLFFRREDTNGRGKNRFKFTNALPHLPNLNPPLVALLPFLLYGAVWLPLQAYHEYFVLWANDPVVQRAHDIHIINLVKRMEEETDPESIFLLPREIGDTRTNYSLDYLYHGRVPFRYVIVEEETIRQTLTAMLADYRTVFLITRARGAREWRHRRSTYNILPFLFEKYGKFLRKENTEDYTFAVYKLNATQVDFTAHLKKRILPEFKAFSFVFANQVELIGVNHQLEDGSLLVDLIWQGIAREDYSTDVDYTVFIQLLDSNGERITGVDVLPEKKLSMLDNQEVMIAHYAIPIPEDIDAGTYTMLVGLYYLVGNNELVNIGSVKLDEAIIFK